MSEKKLFIPQKIKVGFQKREGTYTGKLAYVIYYDQLGKLRKETSWQSWRDQEIDDVECDNEPMEGFVLNKGVGGKRHSYGWNARNEYIRVYDPRDFEFEISVANLLFILRECNCSKGKGLEGKFVYAWDGTELVLLPVSCEEYKASNDFTALQAKKVSAKELVLGASYMTKSQDKFIYLGYFPRYRHFSTDRQYSSVFSNKLKACSKSTHVFWDGNSFVFDMVSKLGAVISDVACPDYAELVQKYHNSKYGTKIVNLFLKDATASDKKHRPYYAYEEGGKYVIFSDSAQYITTHRKASNDQGILIFEDYVNNSYSPVCQKSYPYGHYRYSTIPWVPREHKILWAELESGKKFKVGYYGFLGDQHG